ncbi:MAG: restriction endonuclease subunit S [Campylobacteraceae bacterium]|nr:restriction endonuclease subunit S [Campylobacteraceae bacterium]
MSFIKYKIGDIIKTLKTGKTPPSNIIEYFDGNVNWFTPSDLGENKNLLDSKRKVSNFAVNDNKVPLLDENTILISTTGSKIGKVGILKNKASLNQQLTGITVNDNILNNELFYYWLILNKVVLEKKANISTIPILNNKLLKKINISFPKELTKQELIVSRLNKIENICNKRKHTIRLLEEYLKSCFTEMFLENRDKKSWKYNNIKEEKLIKRSTYGIAKKANSENGMPMLRMGNISYSGEILLNDMKYIELDSIEKEKYKLKKRTILFNRTNSPDLVGKSAVWEKSDNFTYAGYLINIELDEKLINPYYFSSYLNSSFGKLTLKSKARISGNLANISASTLKKLKILIPPLDLQKKYELIFLKVQYQLQKQRESLSLINDLFTIVLNNSFNPELNINEESYFEDILPELTTKDMTRERLIYLIDLINTNTFKNISSYNNVVEKLFNLLDDEILEQKCLKKEIKIKVKK